MIISSTHEYIFAAIPKTGTHAVRQALRPHMQPSDMEQVGLMVKRKFPVPELARIGHGHVTLDQARKAMDRTKFDRFFKFAFVRNPFDRFVSYCAFRSRGSTAFRTDPQRVMRHFIATAPMDHILFVPQHMFVTDPGGTMLADYVGRVETMQESFDSIAGRIGIPSVPLDKVNSSERASYREYYDRDLIDGVAAIYARDLELFDYEY